MYTNLKCLYFAEEVHQTSGSGTENRSLYRTQKVKLSFVGCWGGVYSFQLSVSAPANNPKTTQQDQPSHWVEKQPSTWVKTYEK